MQLVGRFVADPQAQVTVSVVANVSYYDVVTRNLVVDTDVGDPDSVVVVGSHIDSVSAGPGINDDGTRQLRVLVRV